MPDGAPFDVWDGEELGGGTAVADAAPEEAAMHVAPDGWVGTERWAADGRRRRRHETRPTAADERSALVRYFADEQPEAPFAAWAPRADEREPELTELLARQHYYPLPG